MLGARNGAWAKSGYTAKDYVQDGLIFRFDGIENENYGLHNGSLDRWCDLSGNGNDAHKVDGVSIGNPIWTDDAFTGDRRERVLEIGNVFEGLDEFTIQFCGLDETYSAWFFHSRESNGDTPWRYIQIVSYDARTTGIRAHFGASMTETSLLPDFITSNFAVVLSHKTVKIYLGGRLYKVMTIGGGYTASDFAWAENWWIGSAYKWSTSFPMPSKSKIHSIAGYGRSLSDSEIAANYAIDKARFNLP